MLLLLYITILTIVSIKFINRWKVESTPQDYSIKNLQDDVKEMKNTIQVKEKWFLLEEKTCSFIETWEYKYIDLANNQNRIYTSQNPDYKEFTKPIEINWNIDDAYLCIVIDISEKKDSYKAYRKYKSYNWVTYFYFSSSYKWFINVWRSLWNNQFYDSNSSNLQPVSVLLNGKIWSHELPYRYLLDLKNVIIADKDEWWFLYIAPINILKDWNIINVGWYMSALGKSYRASSVSSYRIIYKWDWNIKIN